MLKLDAAIYTCNNSLQKDDANYTLTNYQHLMSFKNMDTILDVGTGDGCVLVDFILPKLPQNYQKVDALDINPDMLRIARQKSKKLNIEFICLDIATPHIPLKLQESYDHIFSFYCIHWVADQRKGLGNLFLLLRPGGDMLLTLIANHTVFDLFEKLSKTKRWSPYMPDVKRSISPYQSCDNAAQMMDTFLKKVGFVDCKSEIVDRVCVHDNFQNYWKFACAVNPFFKNIPVEELDDYEEDFLKEMKKVTTVRFEKEEDLETKIFDYYQMLIVFGKKPEK